jgi:hypothetical protein
MKETQSILLKMGFKNLNTNVYDSDIFGVFILHKDATPKQLAEFIYKRGTTSNERPIVMIKDWFTESDDGAGGKMIMAECPNCGDAVVWNDGCIACGAIFDFRAEAIYKSIRGNVLVDQTTKHDADCKTTHKKINTIHTKMELYNSQKQFEKL